MLLATSLAAMLAAASPLAHSSEGPEVRVRPCADGPGLFVDGRRVAPWMFSVRDGSRSRPVTKDWTRLEFTARPQSDRRRCQFHLKCVLPERRGFIRFRNFSVTTNGVDVEGFRGSFDDAGRFARRWKMWPPMATTGWTNYLDHGEWVVEVGPIENRPERTGYLPHSSFFDLTEGVECKVAFETRSDNVRWLQTNIYAVDDTGRHYCPVAMDSEDMLAKQVRLAAAAGIDIVSYLYGESWTGEGDDYDFAELDATSDRILRANPKALLVPRFGLDAPDAWLRRHPDSRMRYDGATGQVSRMAAVSNPEYRAAACRYLRALIAHMQARYPHAFAGVHPCGQQTHEWFYCDSPTRYHGYDPSTRRAFGEEPPSVAARTAHDTLGFVNTGVCAQTVFRFNQMLQREMADFLALLARTAREATAGRKLVIIFYGYTSEFATMETAPANSGHYALQRLLDRAAADIDMIAAPLSYRDRGWTGVSAEMGSPDTILRAGVLAMDENDTRTHLDRITPQRLGSSLESYDVVKREMAQSVLRGTGCWLFDIMGRSWWDDPELWRQVAETRPLFEDIRGDGLPPEPDVALVNDEDSILRMAAGVKAIRAGWPFVTEVAQRPPLAGFSAGHYLLSDIARRPVVAKLQLFLSSWGVSDDNLERIVRQRQTHPAMRVWVGAPGWIAADGTRDMARMNRLTGFTCRRVARAVEEKAGWEPMFTVAEELDVEVWSRWHDGSPRVAVRRDGKGWSVFMGRPEFYRPALLRRLAAQAGVHLFLPDAEVGKAHVWSRNGRLLVQATGDGPVRLVFPDGRSKTLTLRKGQCEIVPFEQVVKRKEQQ